MKQLSFYLLIFYFGCWAQVSAQNVTLTAKADSSVILIGDPLGILLVADAVHGADVSFPNFADVLKSSDWEFLRQDSLLVSPNGATNLYKQKIYVTAWKAGDLEFPIIEAAYQQQGGAAQKALSSRLKIMVQNPPLVDSTYVADIKDILAEEAYWWEHPAVLWAGASALVLAILAGMYWAWKHFRTEKIRPISPEELAFQKLDKLLAADYIQKGQIKEYHTEISYILREYLQRRFNIKALSQPTGGIFFDLSGKKDPAIVQFLPAIKEILETADLIKYAKASALPAAHTFAADQSKAFVKMVSDNLNPSKNKN